MIFPLNVIRVPICMLVKVTQIIKLPISNHNTRISQSTLYCLSIFNIIVGTYGIQCILNRQYSYQSYRIVDIHFINGDQ